MATIAQNGRWRITVVYHHDVTIYTTWAEACTYYVEDTATRKIFNTYEWSRNEMCEESGPVSVSFTENGRAILLKYHDGSTSIEPLPD